MNPLPPPLQPWIEALSTLPARSTEFIGPWLPKLSAAIGTLKNHPRHTQMGEPDGYDGVSRQGSYERLLLTEWALAEAIPSEFLRRAVMNEQLYLHPAQIEPQGNRRTVVLFDAGPEQAGSLRVTHLGVLLVFKHRVERAGGELHWGLLQHPDLGLWTSFDHSNSRNLFKHRSPHNPTSADRAAWTLQLDEELQLDKETNVVDDCWVVGGSEAWIESWRRVVVEDPCEAGPLVAHVHIHTAHNIRMIELSLPPDPIAHLLLTHPLTRPVNKQALSSSSSTDKKVCHSMFFNEAGGLLLIHIDHVIKGYQSPQPYFTQFKKSQVLYLPVTEVVTKVVAYGRRKKRVIAVVERDEVLYLANTHIKAGIPKDPRFFSPDLTRPATRFTSIYPGFLLLVHDRLRALWLLDFDTLQMHLIEPVSSLPILGGGRVAYLKNTFGSRCIEIRKNQQGLRGILDDPPEVLELSNGPLEWRVGLHMKHFSVMTLPEEEGWWRVYRLSPTHLNMVSLGRLQIPESCEVIGARVIDKSKNTQQSIEIFVLDSSHTEVISYNPSYNRLLYGLNIPIIRANICPTRSCIALWLANQTLRFIDLDDGKWIAETSIDLETL